MIFPGLWRKKFQVRVSKVQRSDHPRGYAVSGTHIVDACRVIESLLRVDENERALGRIGMLTALDVDRLGAILKRFEWVTEKEKAYEPYYS